MQLARKSFSSGRRGRRRFSAGTGMGRKPEARPPQARPRSAVMVRRKRRRLVCRLAFDSCGRACRRPLVSVIAHDWRCFPGLRSAGHRPSRNQLAAKNGASRSRKSSSSRTGLFENWAGGSLDPDLVGVGVEFVGCRRCRRRCGRNPGSRRNSCCSIGSFRRHRGPFAPHRGQVAFEDVVGEDVAAQFAVNWTAMPLKAKRLLDPDGGVGLERGESEPMPTAQ